MFYSQKSYPKDKLGAGKLTISQAGCFLVSLCNLVNRDPIEVNKLFIKEGVYQNGDMLVSAKAAEVLGIGYRGKVTKDPGILCIAETNHYAKLGVPQHFFLYKEGKRVDPLDLKPDWESNDYKITSFRLFSPPTPTVTPQPEKAPPTASCEPTQPLRDTIERQQEQIDLLEDDLANYRAHKCPTLFEQLTNLFQKK